MLDICKWSEEHPDIYTTDEFLEDWNAMCKEVSSKSEDCKSCPLHVRFSKNCNMLHLGDFEEAVNIIKKWAEASGRRTVLSSEGDVGE